MMKLYYFIFLLLIDFSNNLLSQNNKVKLSLQGQVIGWTNLNFSDGFGNQTGGRYLPEVSITYLSENNWKMDGEFSVNAYKSYTNTSKEWNNSGNIKPYRMWLRLSKEQFELRAGLQKINFGSASMLRPLMWFDRLDPRDPLQLTDGVYGLLARYYFLNNSNIWLWVLYGNNDPRGWDWLPSMENIPEFGGRIQLPFFTGELGLSYHHRDIGEDQILTLPKSTPERFSQNKIGLDGKWDVGAGIWFEGVLKNNATDQFGINKWEAQASLGADYTFGIGNGLTAGMEYLNYSIFKSELFTSGTNIRLSALNMSYPIGMVNNLSLILFYSWKDQSFYRFINWSKQYDNFSFYLMTYWNPPGVNIYPNVEEVNLFGGKGFQLMCTFNY